MKRLMAFMLCLFMLFCTSCSLFDEDGSGHTFKMSLLNDPKNLDPQIAIDYESISVSENLFARLIRSNSDGSLTPWAAEDYEISSDGLKYTFYLNENFKWKAAGDYSSPVTAHDFVFAFRRLFDPMTESDYAKEYYCIKNGRNANIGNAPATDIGVYASDDYTLVFELEYKNELFLELLSRLPASPCNEEFFESCRGKYGLEADCIASNGPFYVRYWLHEQYGKDNYVRLTRNSDYSSVSKVYPSGVTYLITANNDVKLRYFTSETTDVLLLNGFDELNSDDFYPCLEEYTASFGLIFNEQNEILAKKDVREVFSMAINREELYSDMTVGLAETYSLYPEGVSIVGSGLKFDNPSVFNHNKSMAEYRWNFLLTEEEKGQLYDMTILVPDIFDEYNSLMKITNDWYEVLGIHFGIEIVNLNDYNDRIKSGDFDILLAGLTSDDGNAVDYLNGFGIDRTYGFVVGEAVNAIMKKNRIDSLTNYVYACLEAQKSILENYHYVPLWQLSNRCYFEDDTVDIAFNPFSGAVIFENAKYF